MARVGGTPRASATVTNIQDAKKNRESKPARFKPAKKSEDSKKGRGKTAPWATAEVRGDPPPGLEPDPTTRRVYQASMMGGCATSLAAAAMGAELADLPDSLAAAAMEGVDNEPIILELLRQERGLRSVTFPEIQHMKDQGWIRGYDPMRREIQVGFEVGTGALVRCHLDDMMVSEDADPLWIEGVAEESLFIVEAKAFAQETWEDWLRKGLDVDHRLFGKYAWQVTAQMLSVDTSFGFPVPCLFVAGLKDEETRAVSEVDITLIGRGHTPIAAGAFKKKVLVADKMAKKGELDRCNEGNWPCPIYFDEHCVGAKDEKKIPIEIDDQDFGSMCAVYCALKTDEKETKEELAKIKTRLDKHISDKGYQRGGQKYRVRSAVGETFEVEWRQVEQPEKTIRAHTQNYPVVSLVEADDE